ncbi:MAG: metallophosphoesterase [Bacteroidota bacterium]|nr:metallophosphoesterase [Bacteroidota bacterium]
MLLPFLIPFQACSKKEFSAATQQPVTDSLLFSFVTVGCNRVDKKDVSVSNPSTANVIQLKRTFSDILELKPLPKFLFFMGDMVLGYTGNDTAALRNELTAWAHLYEESGLKQEGVVLIPMPGNHESLLAKKSSASIAAEAVWVSVMKPYIQNNNGPVPGGADNVQTDQSRLTYSFNYTNTHFVVINTDAVGKESQIPYRWIYNDIAFARSSGYTHIFSFGHKPAIAFPGEDGISSGYPAGLDSFWAAHEDNHAEAYFSAHNHVYYRTRPTNGKTWQIISGNGGSPLSNYINSSSQRNFGFVLVSVYKSGKVISEAYGRDVPVAGYLADPSSYLTTVRDSVEITWGK